ncbi:flagellar protein FliT [Pseudomonas viridiflava]|uniref:flagellar protein FliT n=1 Tax=Pseudomonas viridiflava TaxID=33069 RepID=UPI000F0115F4|nr:flagellar protein FliT [Pseudomonas viridiflava]MBI6683640.1 flagellar protein FliT [Pseudomonas viridiflava]MBI6704042.1 flagellar protein FliT [Pseudomonas viridiflava]MBI6723623.1 flagellar protein FliT [Pseudomonas viridiflava]MEE4070245.1 flagellar protein FliT [Pseudomonas viridiflava]MEE4102516.1 flagellar protein FliT [Pseudomonas viridiflava]
MSAALKRIEETREALVGALAERDWEAIGKLDLACRECVDAVVGHSPDDEPALRSNLEELLGVYRQLIDVATGERQSIVDEMAKIQNAKNATKVYHLFG